MNEAIKKDLQGAYESFIKDLNIDSETGILGLISNPRYQYLMGRGTIRFSGYPFIGSKYEASSPKIMVVGMDQGLDERKDENSFHSFETRKDRIEPKGQSKNKYSIHMAGTYGIILFLLKEAYGWTELWDKYFEGKNETFKAIIRKYGPTKLPYEVLSHVAFTNVHKFVTIGRNNRHGNENRKWYNPAQEKELFKTEIRIFNPDLVYIQGQSKLDREILYFLKKSGKRLVLSDHPSSCRNGANKPTYVEKLKYVH